MKTVTHLSTCNLFLFTLLIVGAPSTLADEVKSGKELMKEMLKPRTGAPFEAEFNDQMIQHHHGAIDMARTVSSRTKRPALTQLAATIVSTQEVESGEVTQWLKK